MKQHVQARPEHIETAGQLILGSELETGML